MVKFVEMDTIVGIRDQLASDAEGPWSLLTSFM